jgi:hypothetical protein
MLENLGRKFRDGRRGLRIHCVPPTHAAARLLAGLVVAAALLSAGCHGPAAPTEPTETVLRIPDRDAFIDASLSMLRRYDLSPERVDRQRGLIVTQRTTSGQWFEPWRIDSQGPYQILESSLHTIGRTVTISVEPTEAAESQAAEAGAPGTQAAQLGASGTQAAQAGASETHPTGTDQAGESPAAAPDQRYRVSVQVDKARFTTPERQITTASGALAIYSERTPTMEGVRGRAASQTRWVPLGRDPLLEAFLLGQLSDVLPEVEVE